MINYEDSSLVSAIKNIFIRPKKVENYLQDVGKDPQLPVEIWISIASYLEKDRSALLKLSLLNKTTYSVAATHIWATATLVFPYEKASKVESRCASYKHGSELRRASVRSCRVSFSASSQTKNMPNRTWAAVASTIISFSGLQHLFVYVRDESNLDRLAAPLSRHHFVQPLTSLTIPVSTSKSVTQLLSSFKHVQHLSLPFVLSYSPGMHLPSFTTFSGPSDIACEKIPENHVTAVDIWYLDDAEPEESQKLADAFSRSLSPIQFLRYPVDGSGSSVISSFVRSVPSLRKLDLIIYRATESLLRQIFTVLSLHQGLEEVLLMVSETRFFESNLVLHNKALWEEVRFPPALRKLAIADWGLLYTSAPRVVYNEYTRDTKLSWVHTTKNGDMEEQKSVPPFGYNNADYLHYNV